MSLEWNSYTLGEIASFKNGKKKVNTKGCYPVYGGNGISDYVSDYNSDGETIIIGRVGAYCGSVYKVTSKCWISDNAIECKINRGNDFDYLFYLISSLKLNNYRIGSTQPLLTQDILNDISIILPNLNTQKKIATILKIIDKKIEINTKINHNLDNLIKILFKNFFEDFKPFENQEFKDSEIGKIPIDWDLVDLGSIIKIYNGYSYKGNELQESNCAMATIKNFNRDGSFRADGFKEILYSDKIKDYHFLNDNDVLISCTDVTQDADIIGNCILLQNKQGYEEVIMSMDLVKIESQIPEINNFLLASILRSYRFKYHILGYVNGTTVLHLDKKGISKFKLALPNDLTILEEFGNTIELIYNQIGNNLKEIDNLSKVRDTLLPKLMSGEIDISKINCDLK